jgi:hypothetical protein
LIELPYDSMRLAAPFSCLCGFVSASPASRVDAARCAALLSCTGITEPVNAGVEAGVRLGLGKQAQDDHYTAAENISRRKLEVEIQAEEAPERRERREVGTCTALTTPHQQLQQHSTASC